MLRSKCAVTDERIRQKLCLSPAEYHAIACISPEEELSSAVFSEKMGLSASRGSRVIQKMIDRGYIYRDQKPDDRRAVVIRLAPEGEKLRNEIDELLRECENKITSALDDRQIAEVRLAMQALIGAL